jgi:nitrate reductase gamma subunit
MIPLLSLALILALVAAVLAGAAWGGAGYFFAVIVPYAAAALFLCGVIYRLARWARSPVPFRVPATGGQQRSLAWIRTGGTDNPSTAAGVWGRMLLEVLLFRSLFRNMKAERAGEVLAYGSSKYLWLGALAFHWSMLAIVFRHLRFFTEPVPAAVAWLQRADGLFEAGMPPVYLTDVVAIAALAYLLGRRLALPALRYLSLAADYLPLLLIIAIAVTGVLMRHFFRQDLPAVKGLALGLVHFAPVVPKGAGPLFYLHLFLVSALAAYLPFGKLAHFAGVFLSPTRNLANTTRTRRHVNPWDYPVTTHTYEEWEREFAEKLKSSGYELESK